MNHAFRCGLPPQPVLESPSHTIVHAFHVVVWHGIFRAQIRVFHFEIRVSDPKIMASTLN